MASFVRCVGFVCVVLYCGLRVCFICSCGFWVGGAVCCYCVVLYVALLSCASFMVCFVRVRLGVVL